MQEFVERRREYTATTVTPLTCYQVITAENMQGDQYKANGRVLSQVSIVGILKSMDAEGNSVKLRIQDAMGYECEVQKWGSDVATEFEQNMSQNEEERKHIVRAQGHVRSGKNGEKIVMATRLSLVQHFEEFMSHQIYASYCLQYHKNGPLPKPVRKEDAAKTPGSAESAVSQQPMHTDPAAVPPPVLPEVKEEASPAAPEVPAASAVAPVEPPAPVPVEAIKKGIMAMCAHNDDGVHKDSIAKHVIESVKGAQINVVKKHIEDMIAEGELFTTKDAFHVSG